MHLANFLVVQLLLCITSSTAKTCVCLQSAFDLNAVDVIKAAVEAVQVFAVAEQRLKHRVLSSPDAERAECEAVNRTDVLVGPPTK